MSILILNRTPISFTPYAKYLNNLSEPLYLLTNSQYANEYHPADYACIELFDNYDHNGQVYLRALELHEQVQFRSILAISEVDILRAAELRKHLGLPGQTVESAIIFRDKVAMKELAQSHNIAVPPFARVTNPTVLLKFIRTHGFPVIMKPATGVGSKDTFILNNSEELEDLLTKGLPWNYIVESFVTGSLYHVDGVVVNGKVFFICASKYLHQPLKYASKGYLGSYLLDQQNEFRKRLIKQTIRLLTSFPTPPNTTFHAEWFHTPDDQILLCEIASRTGGGKIIEMINTAHHVHMVQAFLQPQCDIPLSKNQFHIKPEKLVGWVKIPPQSGKFISAPSTLLLPWIREYQLLATPGQYYQDPNGIGSYIATFVVDGKTEEEVQKKLIYIADWFNHHSQWAD